MMPPKSYLGFDYGTRRIGVAVGQEITRTATGTVTLQSVNNQPDWNGIARLIAEWQPAELVVGLPLNMDDTENPRTALVRRFCNQLRERYKLPVHTMDERLSTIEAQHLLAQPGSKRDRDSDKLAAQLILQSWLEQKR
ncbi:MAG: Holliday junction resolvase RuvX [Gammaproteobacteria bacterium]|nr:Holliday junction resolvase RuvX [Gammaproteobacteria bacterium]